MKSDQHINVKPNNRIIIENMKTTYKKIETQILESFINDSNLNVALNSSDNVTHENLI